MVEPVQSAVLLLVFAAATVTDLWYREVPDWISYTLIAFGLVSNSFVAFTLKSPEPLIASIAGFAITIAFGCALYYLGQWGGGDSKLIMGTGALLGVTWNSSTPLVSFIIYGLFVAAGYGLLYFIYLAIRHRKRVLIKTKERLKEKNIVVAKWATLLCTLVLIMTGFFVVQDEIIRGLVITLAVALYLFFYLALVVKVVEKSVLIRNVDPRKLTEGDWVAEDIVVNNKVMWGPKNLGITKEAIEKVKGYAKQKKITHVTIKEGIPFVPVFLLTYLVTLLLPAPLIFFGL